MDLGERAAQNIVVAFLSMMIVLSIHVKFFPINGHLRTFYARLRSCETEITDFD
jgi:hypothetical protein